MNLSGDTGPLSLLRQRGSLVSFGSLVTLPIAESILYIQPVFITAEEVGIPELKFVVLVSGWLMLTRYGGPAA